MIADYCTAVADAIRTVRTRGAIVMSEGLTRPTVLGTQGNG